MLAIAYHLGRGLVFLVRDHGQSDRVAKALSWRIGLSLGLFLLLIVGFAKGWIVPHGLIQSQ